MAWPLIHRWSSWPSGLTTAYSGLEWPTTALQAARQASPASFSTRGLLLPPPPPPPWQGQVLERGVRLKEGEGKELFWQFHLFLSRRFVLQPQYSFSVPNRRQKALC